MSEPSEKQMVIPIVQDVIVGTLEIIVKRICFWESDSKRIGKLIRFFHHACMYALGIGMILVHTFLPSYIFFVIIYSLCFCIWLQHILTGGCIVSKLEQKLIGDSVSFVDPILEAFHIPITPESTVGIVILGSTTVVGILTLELLSRTILNIQSYFL